MIVRKYEKTMYKIRYVDDTELYETTEYEICFRTLATAVIQRTVDDFREVIKALKNGKGLDEPMHKGTAETWLDRLESCRKFFNNSEWWEVVEIEKGVNLKILNMLENELKGVYNNAIYRQ